MLVTGAVIVILAVILLYVWQDAFNIKEGVGYTLLFTAFAFPIWWIASYIAIAAVDEYTRVYPEQTSLRVLSSGDSEISGSFFLGTGYVDGSQVYTYITERADGGFVMNSIDIDDAVVFEGDYDEPYMENARVFAKNPLWSSIHVEALTHFYIPEGSVQEPSYSMTTED
jgi:hypothetical protein